MAGRGHRRVCQKWQILLQKEAQNRQSDDTQNLRNPARLSGIFCAFFTKTFSSKIKRNFCINCLLTTGRKCGIMAGRAQACGSEIPIGSTYAKFLFNPADFHMASYFPESWHSSPILFSSHHWLIFLISFGIQSIPLPCS